MPTFRTTCRLGMLLVLFALCLSQPARAATADAVAPTTTAFVDALEGHNGWYVGPYRNPLSVVLSATDADSADDVTTYYQLDDEPIAVYTEPILLQENHISTLIYWSEDGAGHHEQPQRLVIPVDMTEPEVYGEETFTPLKPGKDSPVLWTVTIHASDALSGLRGETADYYFYDEYGEYGIPVEQGTVKRQADGAYTVSLTLDKGRKHDPDGRLYTVMIEVQDMAGWSKTYGNIVSMDHARK